MTDFLVIKNNKLEVVISTLGAEIQSIKGACGTNFLWCGDENVWSGKAPILFPICGGLKEDKYLLDGEEYELKKHGYIRNREFEVEKKTEDSVVMLHKSDSETLTHYPFDYEFRVYFTLSEQTLNICYEVKNKSEKTMYFSVGAHEAYACPEGIEEYTAVFEKPETLNAYPLDGNLLTNEYITVLENKREFPFLYKYFAVDALVFKKLESRRVTLVHNNSNKKITLDFNGSDYFLFWTKPNGKYICFEPWCGIPDTIGSSYDIKQKEGILSCKANESFTTKHSIKFEE